MDEDNEKNKAKYSHCRLLLKGYTKSIMRFSLQSYLLIDRMKGIFHKICRKSIIISVIFGRIERQFFSVLCKYGVDLELIYADNSINNSVWRDR